LLSQLDNDKSQPANTKVSLKYTTEEVLPTVVAGIKKTEI
jgi:hypothetical protein